MVDVQRDKVGRCATGTRERDVLDLDVAQFPLWHYGSGISRPSLETGLGAIRRETPASYLHKCHFYFLCQQSGGAARRRNVAVRRWENTNFSKGIGTVVTERVIDSVLVMLLALITVACQIPLFLHFFSETGVSLQGFLDTFSTAGWLVTLVCGILILCTMAFLVWRLNFFSRTRTVFSDLKDGLFSVRYVQNPVLFLVYSLGIWASYYLHFYLTFFCFQYTTQLGPMAALVAFVVGCFAVLVPTPNGAGPWHFAVKNILVLYGVNQIDGALFVLVVHTIQTLLVVALGLYGAAALSLTKKKLRSESTN